MYLEQKDDQPQKLQILSTSSVEKKDDDKTSETSKASHYKTYSTIL